MEIVNLSYPLSGNSFLPPENGQVLAIGDFDGVHLGHQEVIGRAVHIARSAGVPATIMTFDPHPREILGKSQYSQYLAPIRERIELFAALGVDYVYIVRFDPALAAVSAEDYYRYMLQTLHPKAIIVGFDFTFGFEGRGTADTLQKLAAGEIRIEVVPPYNLEGEKVSSTLIREQLYLGRLERVRTLLGRNYSVTGTVVKGDGRGRTIGFPTANVALSEPYVVPRQGVYAVKVECGGRTLNGVMNIGVKPTFTDGEQPATLEVHILHFNQDIYDEDMKIEFVTYLRPEMKFSSVQELVRQIGLDAQKARDILLVR